MATPVQLLIVAKGWTEAGMQLSDEEKDRLWQRVQEVDRRAGAKWLLATSARWANEEISGWAVIEYPDMESYLTKCAELEKLDWWRCFSAMTIPGTPRPFPPGVES